MERNSVEENENCSYDDDENAILDCMSEIKTWVANQPILPELPDVKLRLFLHSCYYDTELAKVTIKAYYSLRVKAPEYFANRNPTLPNLIEASRIAYAIMLPGVTDEGYRVIMVGYFTTDTTNYVFTDVMKRFMMVVDMWLSKLDICPGYYILIDCKNSVFTHYTSASFDSVRKFCLYFQEALPVRLKAAIFINISAAMSMLLTLVRPILSKRLMNLIHKYQLGNDDYMKMVPRRMLPEELSGDMKTIREMQDETQQELEDYSKWFREDEDIINLLSTRRHSQESRKIFGISY